MTTGSKQLPANPNLTHLKKQAKDLKRGVETSEPEALERVRSHHPRLGDSEAGITDFSLRDAQLTIAREYGFDGWHQLSTEAGNRMVEERDLHRWFGVQLNNGMWDAIEDQSLGSHTPTIDKERLLYSAYASAYHWRSVGNEAKFARGEHLISRMAARLGDAELAVRHARRCLELIGQHPEVMEDWDAAFGHEALARALAATGDHPAARRHLDQARSLTARVADPQDRAVLEAELAREPWFDLPEE